MTLDLILKVIQALCNVQNGVSMGFILNQWMDFDQICIETLLEGWEEMVRFWCPCLNFQGHHPIKAV